jgi:S-adenosylmethionine:tRNA ribosyltransferase-isomerase
MKNADAPPGDPRENRLLVVDPVSATFEAGTFFSLAERLGRGDLLVVNDAATLPALLPFRARGQDGSWAAAGGELRLAGAGDGDGDWWAVLFGPGSWRVPTEKRDPPPAAVPGDSLVIGDGFTARVEEVSPVSPRLARVSFGVRGAALYAALYRYGRPVQYSYLRRDLQLREVQTVYASRPWAVEMPSAGRAFTGDLLAGLRARGVSIARLTHAAGLSSTGDAALDARLPLPERYDIPEDTARAVTAARRSGGRVVAVGTSTARALEASAERHAGRVTAETAVTDLLLGPGRPPRTVDGLLTGIHEPGTSHFALAEGFVALPLLEAATREAERLGFRQHEFGDSLLVLPDALSGAAREARGTIVARS